MEMPSVTVKELWMLLGEKDVQIYQMIKLLEKLEAELEQLRPKPPVDPFKKGK